MQDYFIGRQPILDRQYKTVAHELLFQPVNGVPANASPVEMTAKVLVGGLLDIGIHKLSGAVSVFIKVPRDFLIDDVATLFPPETLGLEVQESVPADDEVLAACRRMKDKGYTLILNHYDAASERQALLDVVDGVKIDMQNIDAVQPLLTDLRRRRLKLFATKVETLAQHDRAQQLGFDYFQGYFFCRPHITQSKTLPSSKLAILQALQRVMTAEDVREVEEVIVRDVTLSYRLLRYINSPVFALRGKVKTVQQALSMLGLQNIQRWLSVLTLTSSDNAKPGALITSALLRGRMLEEIAGKIAPSRKSDYFILGMFSLLDVLLDIPMEEALAQVCLPEDIHMGLTDARSELGRLLTMVKRAEQGKWNVQAEKEFCRSHGLKMADLTKAYADALQWVDESVKLLIE